jgi:hypothetical protein
MSGEDREYEDDEEKGEALGSRTPSPVNDSFSPSHSEASQSKGKEELTAHNARKQVAEDNNQGEVSGTNGLLPSLQRARIADKLKGQAVSRQLVRLLYIYIRFHIHVIGLTAHMGFAGRWADPITKNCYCHQQTTPCAYKVILLVLTFIDLV